MIWTTTTSTFVLTGPPSVCCATREELLDGKKTVDRNLKAMGMEIDAIVKATGLSEEEIASL